MRNLSVGLLTVAMCMGIFIGALPSQAAPVSADLKQQVVKVTGYPALYYVDYYGMRHLFSSESIFWTYYSGNWKRLVSKDGNSNNPVVTIKTITQDQFDGLPLGHNMMAATESIIKFSNSATIYKVSYYQPYACAIPETIAATEKTKLQKLAVVIPASFQSDYEYDNSWCGGNLLTGVTAAEISKKEYAGLSPSPEVINGSAIMLGKNFQIATGRNQAMMKTEGLALLTKYAEAIEAKDWETVNSFLVHPYSEKTLNDDDTQALLEIYASVILQLEPADYSIVSRDLNNLVLSTEVRSSQVTEDGAHAIAGARYAATFKFENGALKIGDYMVWEKVTLVANMTNEEATKFIETELADPDRDGLITPFEECQGAYGQLNYCSRTFGSNPDSDDDGYWDGLVNPNEINKVINQ